MRNGVAVLAMLLVTGCPKESATADAASSGPVARKPEPLSTSTGLAKRPQVKKDCPDVLSAVKAKNTPAAAQGLNGADAFTAEELAFLEEARNCSPGERCLALEEPCNCGLAVNAKDAPRVAESLRGKFKCDQHPCCAWGFIKGAAACQAGRCVFVDPEADTVAAALGGGAPPLCPDKATEREKAKQTREVAGMAGIRGGAGLTASDVLVLKNSSACAEADTCVRVEDPCNCGFTVNKAKEASVREVVARLKCEKLACCKWTGTPACRSGECQDTY